jgi:tripartite-type tricarboxylate transporter receptor subunit TctC
MVRGFHQRITVEMSLSRRVALLGLVASARAQDWPTKPLRLVVPKDSGAKAE